MRISTSPWFRLAIFLAITLLCVVATVVIAPRPIAQDQNYHRFADTNRRLGIPNFANVASNIIFILAGIAGLAALKRIRRGMAPGEPFAPVVVFCVGSILTGLGSALYHWNPSDRSLVYDRLGMVVAFAAFIALLVAHFDIPDRSLSLPIFLIAGVGTILFWIAFDDLRPYVLLQGFPLVLIALGSFLFPRTHTKHAMLWLVVAGYVVAKLGETYDRQIFDIAGFVSGHTLKHLVAGVSIWITVSWLKVRAPRTA